MATTSALREIPRRRPSEPLRLRVFEWLVTIPAAALVAVLALRGWGKASSELLDLAIWLAVIALADLMPVPCWGNLRLTMSLPVLLAAGMIYEPLTVAPLAFLGSVDIREFKAEVSVVRALYNRSQVALSATAASAAFHGLGGNVADWPEVLLVGAAALLADACVNTLAVGGGAAIATRSSLGYVMTRLFRESGVEFLVGYVCFGLLAVLLATVFHFAGSWGLLSYLVPLVLARQMFFHGKRSAEASAEALQKSRLLLQVSERIAEERRDERKYVSASLHDEVLQPLYKVHLMGQVVRRDLQDGRLLDLEEDIQELLRATDRASDEIRSLIRDLRRSSLGAGGLVSTLKLLLDDLSLESQACIHANLEEVDGSPLVQLLVYQVAREALLNAIRHAKAQNIWLRVWEEAGSIRVAIHDDGVGFDFSKLEGEFHFGLEMMKERAAAVGGVFHLESDPGGGTRVAIRFPGGRTL
jgi:signal transduction histidine kinase